MLTARRFWIIHNQFTPLPKNSQINLFGKNNFIISSDVTNKLKDNDNILLNEDFSDSNKKKQKSAPPSPQNKQQLSTESQQQEQQQPKSKKDI